MSASRFRPPKTHTPAQRQQPRSGRTTDAWPGVHFEPTPEPVLRLSKTGIRNLARKKQETLRKERKADPNGTGIHSWRKRLWQPI